MEEMLDVFDINGNFLGVEPRSFCHSENPGVFHKPVWIWIINSKGEVLVQQRSFNKKTNPGLWDMPSAGHVDAGENCLDACVRETKEELGFETKPNDFIFLKEFICEPAWEIAQVYLLKVDKELKDMTIQAEEVEKVEWLKFNDFVKLLYSNKFCDQGHEYKDWVVETLKERIQEDEKKC